MARGSLPAILLRSRRLPFCTDEMNVKAVARLDLERYLRQAQERDEFVLHSQPQIDSRPLPADGIEPLLLLGRIRDRTP